MAERFGEPQSPPPGSTWSPGESDIASGSTAGHEQSAGQSTADTAKEQARGVAQQGVEGGKHVASVATDQAKEVASEAGHQARALLDQARSELMDNATTQQDRVAEQLHELSRELGSMASKSEQQGLATDLASQASRQVGNLAQWLSQREPGTLVEELKGFARRKPGTFMTIAAGTGLVAGRMTRGAKAGVPSEGTGDATATPPGAATSPLRQRMMTPNRTMTPDQSARISAAGGLDDAGLGRSPMDQEPGLGRPPMDQAEAGLYEDPLAQEFPPGTRGMRQ